MDREKVIKGLQIERECVSRDCDRNCGKCDLVQDRDWLLSVYDDALALLKKQEAKQAIKQTYYVMMNRDYENPVEVTHYDWLCPTCKGLLCRDIDVIDDNYHFCKVCGQAVKWDD